MTTKNQLLMACLLLMVTAVAVVKVAGRGTTAPPPSEASTPAAGRPVACFGYADVEAGCTPLCSLQPGRVKEIFVRENDPLKAGAPILVLDDTAARARVAEARAALEGAEALLELARHAPDRHRVRLAAQKDALAALNHRLSAARHLLAHKLPLAKSELLSASETAALEDQVKELASTQDAEQKKLVEMQLHIPMAEVRKAEAESAVMRARLALAEQALEECTLKAPTDGTVVRLLASRGEVLVLLARQPAVLFAAQGPRIIRAEVEQEFAGRLKVGRSVSLQDDIDSTLRWRGTVTRISDWYLQRRAPLLEPTRFNDTRTLECIITLEAAGVPVRMGQRVRVLISAEDS